MSAAVIPMVVPAWEMQRSWWSVLHREGGPGAWQTRAIRLTGAIDRDRLAAAVDAVVAAHPILTVNVAERRGDLVLLPRSRPPGLMEHKPPTGADAAAEAVRHLRGIGRGGTDPGHDPLTAFTVIPLAAEDLVLSVSAHVLAADLHSLYATLGRVLQAYFGRHRPDRPSLADPLPRLGAGRPEWWLRRLGDWEAARAGGSAGEQQAVRTQVLPRSAWNALHDVADRAGGHPSLVIAALVSAWQLEREPGRTRSVFATTVDLRDVRGLGSVAGPLSDRVCFAVDLDGYAGLRLPDMLRRTQSGLLDSVVRYLPYGDLLRLRESTGATGPVPWDVRVHFCRRPPSSAPTRNEATLARRGLSVELFHDADLLPADSPSGAAAPGLEVLLGEDEHDDIRVVYQYDPAQFDVCAIEDLARSMDRVAAAARSGSAQ